MDVLQHLIHFTDHIEDHLAVLISTYGALTYFILAFVLFLETGIIIAALLPGDSLLIALGIFIASTPQTLNIHVMFCLLALAAIFGNLLNYATGHYLGPKIFRSRHSWLFNKKYIQDAHHAYSRWGAQVIIIASFFPILRTFSPFVAGMGYMRLHSFILYSVVGAALWVGILLYSSFWFGKMDYVKHHFALIIICVILLSLLPPIFKFIFHKFKH